MNILDTLRAATQGRPFVLVVMAYKDAKTKRDKRAKVFELIRDVVDTEFNMACIRADQILSSGNELLAKIHLLIDRASLIVAEISEPRANVFYELGYAMGKSKTPVLLIESRIKPPYDLQGLEVFEYENTIDGVDAFRERLVDHLRVRLKPQLPLLREMLAPVRPTPSYIVASPKYPGENSRIQGQVYDSRTYGDHLGILGLISAFGQFYEDYSGIELISAQHANPKLLEEDINLYLIGSCKVNPWSEEILKRLFEGQSLKWEFDPAPGWSRGRDGDWPVALYRVEHGKRSEVRGEMMSLGIQDGDTRSQKPSSRRKSKGEAIIWSSDYGIVVRGPHPLHPGRMVVIMAGPHSLGTAAACLTATRPSLIKELQTRLPEGVLEDRTRTFWAQVRGVCNAKDFLLDEDGVTIERVGVY